MTDGNHSINLFGSYVLKKHTMKLMLANVENYGEIIVHLSIDHLLQDHLKIFAEYYRESESAALTPR